MAEIFKINDVDFECEFKLSNPDKQEIKFTKSSIKGMTIVDNIFDPFMSGSISIANPYDFIEKDYFIRGDGRDEFLIKFKPKESLAIDKKNDKFEHTFVIVSDTDIVNPMTRAENIKTFGLIAKDSIPFSDTIPYGKKYSGKVGAILKQIFKEVLGEDKVDEEKWEDGDFQLTYIPPATYRYIDVIHYLMRIYYAKDEEIHVKGFISHDSETGKFKLELLSKIYSESDKNVIDAFGVGDLITDVGFENENNPDSNAPVGKYINGLRNLGYSTPPYNIVTDFFVNSLVFGYDTVLGVHRIKKIEFKNIKDKWKKKFVEPFKAKGGKPYPFAIKNNTTDKKFKRYNFPYKVEDGAKIVEAEIHNALTFYNLQISFTNIGNTVRRAGKFIDIFTAKKDGVKLKSDQKILGRWYVTELRHIFFADLYTNEVYCTKTYTGPKTNIKEDVE